MCVSDELLHLITQELSILYAKIGYENNCIEIYKSEDGTDIIINSQGNKSESLVIH